LVHSGAYLRDSDGLITLYGYYGGTSTATDSSAGSVDGYLHYVYIQHGEFGTPILVSAQDYFLRSQDGIRALAVAHETVYSQTNATGGRTTSYDYSWVTDTLRVESITVTLPVIDTDQNGSEAADVTTVFFDSYGRPVWAKDAAGFIHYVEYDLVTGAVTKAIVDVNTANDEDFSNLPLDWETPENGGLHLVTQYQVDPLGRPIAVTDPNGHVTYVVYKDGAHEVRIYAGWDADLEAPTGPTVVLRQDRARGYTETLTMSAAPNLDENDRPDGSEDIDDVQSLARSYVNAAGQAVSSDAY